MRALLAVVLIAVAAPQTHGILAARIEAERAVSPSPSLNLADCKRQSPGFTPRLNARTLSCQRRDDVLVGCSCPSAAEVLLARLPSRGGAKEGLQQQALAKGGEKNRGAVPRTTTLTSVHKNVAGNLLTWAAIVGAALMCSRTKLKDEEGFVRRAVVGAVVTSTSVQVASNVVRTIWGNGASSALDRGVLAGLRNFRWSYLLVLAVCNFGEYIQGPHMYKIYSEKNGLDMGQIAKMFLAGMVSSMVTGLVAGSFLDRYGRRSGCMLWAVLNVVQCLLIRSRKLGALLLGRVIAGAGATLLATAFESWMVTEHHSRKYPSHLLADTFRMATWGIGLATIVSGFVAEASVKGRDILAPFNVAIGVSLVALVLIGLSWTENYGDRSFSALNHTQQALGSIAVDGRLLMMGLVQALFEGSMMTWIVVWVPALQNAPESKVIALGTVFSTLMMSMCGGSSLFKLLTEGLPERLALSPEACLVAATGLATTALAASSMGLTAGKLLFMFLVYETCIGLYFPAMATCRSKYIDDRMRGTVMNIFRVPMNLVAALMMIGPLGNRSWSIEERVDAVFGILAGLTGVATLIQILLLQREREYTVARLAFGGAESGKNGETFSGPQPAGNLGAERKGREALKAKQPIHGMPVVLGTWSRLPRAATPPGAIAVGIQRQGHHQGQRERQGQRQLQKHGRRQGQRQEQEQRNAGALQGWMEESETTAVAGYGISNASPPSLSSPPSSSSLPSPSSSPTSPSSATTSSPASSSSPIASKTSSRSTTFRKAQPEAIQSTPRAKIPKSCKAVTTATRTNNSLANESFKPKSSKKQNSASSQTAPDKCAKHSALAPAPAPATPAAAPATTSQLKPPQGKSTGQQPKASAVGVTASPAKGKVTAFVSTVAGGVLATAGWFIIRASSPPGQATSGDHPNDRCENTWNPFVRDSHSHNTGDRHPSWSSRPNNPNDAASPGNNKVGASQASNAHVPPAQGRGQEVDAKEGNENLRAGSDDKRGEGAKTDGDIEREWPVFGSDGVGGRFGAF